MLCNNNKCQDCDIDYEIKDDQYLICPSCGNLVQQMDEQVSYGAMNAYGNGGVLSIRGIGGTSHIYNSSVNTREQRIRATKDQLLKLQDNNKGIQLPANVIDKVSEFYSDNVQNLATKRNAERRKILAACIYNICIEENVWRSPQEIAILLKLSLSKLNHGVRFLAELRSKGRLAVPDTDPYVDVKAAIHRCTSVINILHMTEMLEEFVIMTIKYEFAPACKLLVRCIGSIIFMSTLSAFNIDRKVVQNEFHVTAGAIGRFISTITEIYHDRSDNRSTYLSNFIKKYALSTQQLKHNRTCDLRILAPPLPYA